MKNQFILTVVFALLSLSLFGQEMSVKRTMHDKDKLEKINKGDSLERNCPQCKHKTNYNWGYQIGMGEYNRNRFFLNYISSYQIKSDLSLGFGGAMHYYPGEEAILVSFLTEFRINVPYKNNLPYLAIRYGFPFYEYTDTEYFKNTGFLLNASLGYSFNIPYAHINMEVGYALQEADVYDSSGLNNDIGLHAISLSLGILMKK